MSAVGPPVESLFRKFAATGDADALATVFDRTAPRVLRVAIRLGRDSAEAEDLLQATFLTAIEDARSYDASRPLLPWLLGILTNRVRSQRRVPVPVRSDVAPLELVDPERRAESSEFDAALQRALDGLAATYRGVLVLHLRHGLTPIEVAHALDRSPGTVRSQIARGLSMLRKALPPSFVAGLGAIPTTRGIDTIRDTVLRSATLNQAALVTGSIVTLGISMKKLLAAAAAVLVTLIVWTRFTSPPASTPIDHAGNPAPAVATARPGAEPAGATESAELRTPVAARAPAGIAVTGRLVYEGPPADALELGFVEWSDATLPVRGDRPISTTWTRPDGGFALTVPPRHPGFLRLLDDRIAFRDGDGDSLRFHGSSADLDLGELVVVRAARIAGRVLDVAGAPVAGATIVCLPEGRTDLENRERYHARTDGDGHYELHGFGHGGFQLCLWATGFVPQSRPLFVAPGIDPDPQHFIVDPGGTVRGRVVDDAGNPIGDATVASVKRRDFGGGLIHNELSTRDSAQTDAEGRFAIGGLVDQHATLHVTAAHHMPATSPFTPVGADAITITLRRGGAVRGRVVDRDGHAVAGSVVRYDGSRSPPGIDLGSATTDADGHFELGGLPPGPGRLTVRGAHPPHTTGELPIVSGGSIERTIRVARGAVLRVSTTASGEPVTNARVKVYPQGAPSALARATTGADGSTTIDSLAPGRYEIAVEHAELIARSRVDVDLADDGQTVAIELERGGFAEITLLDARGDVVAGRQVTVASLDDGPWDRQKTDANGQARFGPWPRGRYETRVFESPHVFRVRGAIATTQSDVLRRGVRQFDVSAAETTRVEVTLERFARVGGTVLRHGRALPGAQLVLTARDGGEWRATHSDRDGRYAFADVPPGEYLLYAGRHGAPIRAARAITIEAGDLTEDWDLEEGELRFRCLDTSTGAPISGVRAFLARDGAAGQMTHLTILTSRSGYFEEAELQIGDRCVLSDGSGTVVMPGVPPGDYELRIRADRHRLVEPPKFEIAAGAAVDLGAVELRPAGTILGVVFDADGYVVHHGDVQWQREGAQQHVRINNGGFRADGLKPGTYRLRARAGTEFGPVVEVTIDEGAQRRVELVVR